MTQDDTSPALDAALLEILRCPACQGAFGPPGTEGLTCRSCARRYPVRNGVPILLVDEAAATDPTAAPAAG